MNRAFIYIGGHVNVSHVTEHPKGDDLVIAADSGYDNAIALGESPAVVLGDFDSVSQKEFPESVTLYRVPAEKDMTDTRLAVDYALSKGATDIVLVGGLSGRLDHTLANLSLFSYLTELGVSAVITDGDNRVRLLRNSSIILPGGAFPYLSLIVTGEKAKGVSVKGCKYPLENATLRATENGLAVSNEITGNCALVEVRKGTLLVVESR